MNINVIGTAANFKIGFAETTLSYGITADQTTGFGLEKMPTKKFHANWAWLLIGQLAFNLVAWFKRLCLPEAYRRATIKTLRHHLFNVAAKVVSSGRQLYLVISDDYRYQHLWSFALNKLAALAT